MLEPFPEVAKNYVGRPFPVDILTNQVTGIYACLLGMCHVVEPPGNVVAVGNSVKPHEAREAVPVGHVEEAAQAVDQLHGYHLPVGDIGEHLFGETAFFIIVAFPDNLVVSYIVAQHFAIARFQGVANLFQFILASVMFEGADIF